MSSIGTSQPPNSLDRYVVVHVATTCDEHGVYVTKDSAEVIELGWILLDGKTLEEVCARSPWPNPSPCLSNGQFTIVEPFYHIRCRC